jgi:hypothetical protein
MKKTIQAIEDAMILLGNHASKETDLGSAIDDAWSKLDDILQSIKDGHYNSKGKFVG